MALKTRNYPITLDIGIDNEKLPFSILQGSTDLILLVTLSRGGDMIDVDSVSKVDLTIIYPCKTGIFEQKSGDSGSKITITDNVISVPFIDEMVTASGENELVLNISDGANAYTYGIKYDVDQNPAYTGKSVPDNLPTFDKVKEEVEQIKQDVSTANTNIQTNEGNIQTNTKSIQTNSQDVSDIKSTLSNHKDQIDKNTSDIQKNTQNVATKADSDLSNVGSFGTASEGDMFYKKGDKLEVAPININDGNRRITTAYSLQTAPSTVYLGPNLAISQNGGFVENHTKTLDKYYLMLDYENDRDTGSKRPMAWPRGAKQTQVVQQSADGTVMNNVSEAVLGNRPDDHQTQAIYFKFVDPVTNFKMKINVNGADVMDYPYGSWDNGDVAGFNKGTNIQKIDLQPFWSTLKEYNIKLLFKADGPIKMLGNGTIPWYAVDMNPITRKQMAYLDDVQSSQDLESVLTEGDDANGKSIENIGKLSTKPLNLNKKWSIITDANGSFVIQNQDGATFLTVDQTGKIVSNSFDSSNIPSGGSTDFKSLTDTPGSYSGQSGKMAVVKSSEDGLEFALPPIQKSTETLAADLNGLMVGKRISYNSLDDTPGGGTAPVKFTDLTDTPSDYIGSANKMVVVNSAHTGLGFADIPSGSDPNNEKFAKAFGIEAANMTGQTINAGRFVMIAPKNDNTFGMVELTKQTGYRGELFGYLRNLVANGAKGFVELITTIATGQSATSLGQAAYIGFDVDSDLAMVQIAKRNENEIEFGRCGVFGEKGVTGLAYATFNAFQVEAENLIDVHADENIDYHETLPAVIDKKAKFVYLIGDNISAGGTIIQNLPPLNTVEPGTQIIIENRSDAVTSKIQVVAETGDQIQGSPTVDVAGGGHKVILLATKTNWMKLYDNVELSDNNIKIGRLYGDYGLYEINEIELHSSLTITKDPDNPSVQMAVSPQIVSADASFVEVKKEVDRLKTDINEHSLPIYTYRGKEMPVIPDTKYKSYFLTFFAMASNTNSLIIPSPTQPLEEGTIFVVDNNDRKNPMYLNPGNGKTINGNAGAYKLNPDTMVFLIKTGNDWNVAFSGLLVRNLQSIVDSVKSKLNGSLHTIDEIKAQLKDRLHTFSEIQSEFSNQLHTPDAIEAEMIAKGFSKGFSVGYGTLSTSTPPQDLSWVQVHFAPNAEVVIPASNQGMKYLAIYMPIFFGALVGKVEINQAEKEFTESKIVDNELDYTVFTVSEQIDTSTTNRLNIEFHSQGTIPGVGFDDGATDAASITKVILDGIDITDVSTPNQVTLKASTEWDTLDGMGGGNVNRVLVMPPLQTYLDPKATGDKPRIILEVEHDYYELAKPPGYLAYLTENEEVVGRVKPNEPGVRVGAIWFDDIIVGGNSAYIGVDKPHKSLSVEDYTEDDPNVTGGIPTLIAFRVAMKGKATSDGFVEIMLKKTDEGTPTQNGDYMLDSNGNPIGLRHQYKTGDDLGVLDCMAIHMAKEQVKFQCLLEHNFADDGVMLEDRTEGASGILIQALGNDYATGDALLQFENDTMQNIEMTKHYNGEDIFNIAWALGYDQTDVDINAGDGETSVSGLHFYNNTNLKVGIADKTIHIHDNGTDMAYFSLGQIFSAEKTYMLKGKDLDIKLTLQDKDSAFIVYMVKWTGVADKYTTKVIDRSDSSLGAVPETNWELSGNIFISEDSISGEHDFMGTLTVPADANNFAIVIVPREKQLPVDLYVKGFEINVSEPFYGWILEAPELVSEKHLQFDEKHAELRCDVGNFAEVRYTLNDVPAGMPMPIGVIKSGKADIEIGHAINQVAGSSLPDFEGAIKFNKEGKATIKTDLYVHSEKEHSVLATTSFWYSKVSSDGKTFTKIPLSEYTTQVRGQTKAINHMPKFEITVEPGDRIALFGTTDQADGAFIDTTESHVPMLKTVITFDEITEVEQNVADLMTHADEIVFVKAGTPVTNPQDYALQIDVDTGRTSIITK